MLRILSQTLLESAPYILLGFLIAGILRFWVPRDILQRHLGGRSAGTLLKSVGVGCILPLCSCGTIPLGIGLFRSGASLGNMLAFMTSTPILSPVLIALALKMLGVKLTTTLVISSVTGAYLMGWLGNRLFHAETKKGQGKMSRAGYMPGQYHPREKPDGGTSRGKVRATLRWSFLELGSDVSVDILIGLGIASLLMAVLPLEWISRWLGQQNLSTLIYVVLLGIPVYACSIPSIAVVQGLLLLGASPGAAIAYMIAGPATNLGELNAIRRSMGTRPALFYAASLISLALLAGSLTDHLVFPDYQYHAYRVQGELVVKQCCVPVIFGEGVDRSIQTKVMPAWYYPPGMVLLSLMALGVLKKLKHFFVNPCRSCTWKAYGADGFCGSRCHIRRKYEWLHRRLFPVREAG
jgi:uncharacterized membrane protein YraQ (UPF0718 family)